MAKPHDSTESSANDPAGAASLPGSVWPDTAHLRAASGNSLFEVSHFDPQFDAKARARQQLATLFDLCRPALGLRVLLGVQAVLLLAALPLAEGWLDGLMRASVLAFAGLAATLVWLPAVCGLRLRLSRQPSALREGGLAGQARPRVCWAGPWWPGLA